MILEELQDIYHNKVVRVKSFYQLPEVDYVVTALVEDGGGFVFAVRDVNYTIETKRWYTFFCKDMAELELVISRFEAI